MLLVMHQALFESAAHPGMPHGTAQRIVIEVALDQVILGAGFQRGDDQRLVVLPGQHHDRRTGYGRAHRPQRGEPG